MASTVTDISAHSLVAGGHLYPIDYEEVAAIQDADYLYFGYWLQSPEDPGADDPDIHVRYLLRWCKYI